MTESPAGRSDRRAAVVVAGAAALLHTAVALFLFPADSQFAKYPRAAAQYLAGTLPPERLLDFSPLYFHLHVLQQALVAGQPIIWVQIAAVAGASGFVHLLLLRFFPRPIAYVGTAAFVLNPSVLTYSAVLEPEPFLLLGLSGLLYHSLLCGRRNHLIAGLFLALAVAVRPNVLPILGLVPLLFLARRGRAGWMRPTLAALAPALVVLLALGARNGLMVGTSNPVGMNPGFVFFEGNNPLSSGRSAVYPPLVGELKDEIAEHPDSPHLTYRMVASRADPGTTEIAPAEANRYWRDRAVSFLRDEPARAIRLLGTKVTFIFHDYGRHDLVAAHRLGRRLRDPWIPTFPFALVSSLALFGLVTARRDWRRLLLIYGLFAAQTAVMVATYVSDRQRLAIVPCFVFFACAGLLWLIRLEGRTRVAAAGAALALAAVLLLPNDLIREDQHLWEAYGNAETFRVAAFRAQAEGRFTEAAVHAARSFAAAPWLRDYARPAGARFEPEGYAERALAALPAEEGTPSQRLDRARLLLEAGRDAEAQAVFEKLHEADHRFDRGFAQSSEPLYYLAVIASRSGRPDEAARLLERALDRTPGDPFALARLEAIVGSGEHHALVTRYFGVLDADFLVGLAQLEEGTADHGVARLAATARRVPELWRVRIYLAAALGEEGEVETATEVFRHAMASRQEQVMLEDRIVDLFSRAATDGGDGALHYGLVLAQYGRIDEAIEVLRRGFEAEGRSEFEQAIRQLEALSGG